MTDTTYNTLVTFLTVIAVIIAIVLLGRFFQRGTLGSAYVNQPASAYTAFYGNGEMPTSYGYDSVTAYSRPSTFTDYGTTTYTTTSTVYTVQDSYTPTYYSGGYPYRCSTDGKICW